MTPRTLRRKLQKKLKHKPYRKCPACGARATCRLDDSTSEWRLFKQCGCGYLKELFWTGQVVETGRHIPDSGNAGTEKA